MASTSDVGNDISKASKYDITARPTGFVVSGKDRGTVEVEMNGTSFVVTGNGDPLSGETVDDFSLSFEADAETIGICCYYDLNRAIANRLMSAWVPPKGKPRREWVTPWARKQTERAINGRIHEQWKRLLTKADQRAVRVQRSLFAATMTCPSIAHSPELYENRFVVSDISNYRGAAIAAANVNSLAKTYIQNLFKTSPEFTKILGQARDLGLDVRVARDYANATQNTAQRKETEMDMLTDWQSLFSITGRKYPTLSRTLMNLPGHIPHGLFCRLAHTHLPRPITDRLELLAKSPRESDRFCGGVPRRNRNMRDKRLAVSRESGRSEMRTPISQKRIHVSPWFGAESAFKLAPFQ